MNKRSFRVLAVVVGVLALAHSPVFAQTADEARTQRDATRAEQARVAKELDGLRAQESEIRAALEGLDLAIEHQQSRVDAARQALRAAEDQAAARQRELDATRAEIVEVRARTRAAVVDAYVGGVGSRDEGWLASSDASEASQRSQLIDVVRGRFTDDLERLRFLGQEQERLTAEAEAAVADAAEAEAELDAALAELQSQREAQYRLEQALRERIGDYEAQAASLEAAEAELTAVINRHLAEEAARAAARASSASAATAPAPRLTSSSSSGFITPASGPVTSPFGYRRHPILGSVRLHAGIDIGAPYGAPIWSSKSGTVIFAGWNGGYGYCVIVSHAGGISTLYAHMSEIATSVGATVSQGEVVGWVGSTGQSTGPHLHFETRVGGVPEDPMLFL